MTPCDLKTWPKEPEEEEMTPQIADIPIVVIGRLDRADPHCKTCLGRGRVRMCYLVHPRDKDHAEPVWGYMDEPCPRCGNPEGWMDLPEPPK